MLIRNNVEESEFVCARVDRVVIPAMTVGFGTQTSTPQPVLDFLWDVTTSRWDVDHNIWEPF